MKIDGHEIVVTPSSFQNAMALKRAIAKALLDQGVDLGLGSINVNTKDILKTDLSDDTIESLLSLVLSVGTSEQVIDALFACATSAIFKTSKDTFKIDRDFFELENREYFYPIMIEIAKVNISPFFKKMGSWFENLQGILPSTQK